MRCGGSGEQNDRLSKPEFTRVQETRYLWQLRYAIEGKMLFIVNFIDHSDRLHVRKEFMSQHLSWLQQHSKQVLVAGSLRTDPSANPLGACWIVRLDDKQQVEDLLRTDPFWLNGLRSSHEILFWSKAFPDVEIPI